MTTAEVIIRQGTREDVPVLLKFIIELAIFEKSGHEVFVTEDVLLRDGFGERPLFGFFIAEVNGVPEGIALYYYAYSTWKGKFLYLEDLVVKETSRQLGIGTRLFKRVEQKAREEEARLMGWQVLDWNEPAIRFYKKHGAKLTGNWLNGRIYF